MTLSDLLWHYCRDGSNNLFLHLVKLLKQSSPQLGLTLATRPTTPQAKLLLRPFDQGPLLTMHKQIYLQNKFTYYAEQIETQKINTD